MKRALAALVLVLAATAGHSQLNGHNLRGDYGLMAGTQPPPGFWVGLLYANLDIDTVRNRNGSEIPSSLDLDYHAIVPYLWWVSKTKVLGGNYSIFVAPSWANSSLEAPVLGIGSTTGVGYGDLYVQPIVLGWHKERADYLVGLGVNAPTGRYEVDGEDNTGLGMWTYEAFGGVTLHLNQAKTWNLAAVAFYATHSSKDGTNQKVGDLVTVEGGLGRTFKQGSINVGLVYFGQWKISDDDLGLAITPPDDSPVDLPNLGRHQIFGAGPEVTLPLATRKTYYGSVTLRYYWDFGVESNAESQTFLLNLSMPVPFQSLTESL